jgi:hypothetical protein
VFPEDHKEFSLKLLSSLLVLRSQKHAVMAKGSKRKSESEVQLDVKIVKGDAKEYEAVEK